MYTYFTMAATAHKTLPSFAFTYMQTCIHRAFVRSTDIELFVHRVNAKLGVIKWTFANVHERLQTFTNAQLYAHERSIDRTIARSKRWIIRTNASHGAQTFDERSQERLIVRAFARSNVQLIAETFCIRLRIDPKIRRSIVLYNRY
jgi:hypothetical protein